MSMNKIDSKNQVKAYILSLT